MTYALGRRVEYYDMPTVRAIVRDAGAERQPHLVVRPRRRQQPGVPDGAAPTTADDDATTDGRVDSEQERRHVHHAEAPLPPHGPARAWASPWRCRSSTRWCRRARRSRRPPPAPARSRLVVHRDGARRRRQHASSASRRTCGRRRTSGTRLRPVAEQPRAARAVPRLPDHRQQHRRAQRRGVHAAGDRRRSLPLERGVPDAVASEADAGLRRARRHLARSDLRAEVRPGHADSVDAAVHRERRSGRRLRLRLLVRLHRLDQLGVARPAAADDPRPARGVRSAVRRRRHAGRARAAPRDRQEHPRLGRRRRWSRLQQASSAPPIARGSTTTSTTSARSSAASSRSRRATAAANRASCPARRSACPTRSTSTSS